MPVLRFVKTILTLIGKDLRRDWKHPWTILLFSALPLLMTGLMAAIFSGHSGSASMPTMHVAVLDNDRDLLTRALRSISGQGDAAKQLQLHFVETRQEGLVLMEQQKASALVIFPTNMTTGLLDGRTNTIELYENPAQQILPKVARQGVFIIAQGLSAAAELLGEPLRDIRAMGRDNEFPTEAAVVANAAQSVRKLGGVKTYLFPPLIQFQTVEAADYVIASTNAPSARP